jgi:hypothetical protein
MEGIIFLLEHDNDNENESIRKAWHNSLIKVVEIHQRKPKMKRNELAAAVKEVFFEILRRLTRLE